MKAFAATLVAGIATAQNLFLQDQVSSLFRPTTDAKPNSAIDVAKIFAEWTATEFQRDYEAQADYIQSATETVKS